MHHRALQVLHNPRYAGIFSYGKRQGHRNVNGTKSTRKQPQKNWHAYIENAHEGYISAEEFKENLQILEINSQIHGLDRRKSPPREGNALLQGLVICGICGKRMTVRYRRRFEKSYPSYMCQKEGIEHAKKICQIIPGSALDIAVSNLLVDLITPLILEVTLAVQKELKSRRAEIQAAYYKEVERVRYEAE